MTKHYRTSKETGFQTSEIIEKVESKETIEILVDNTKTFQKIIGFGGAFTESSAYTLSKMDPLKRQEVLEAYFDKNKGLNYNIGRVHIHSCDFSLENFTYVEDFDKDLKTFSIKRDFKWVIPMIKDAEKIAGHKIELLASPWSPPAWMKSNNDMNHGGVLLPEYYQAWANYYVKFIEEYTKNGLDVFSITVQNEPAAVQVWDSCIYSAEQERDFVKHYLGPTLKEKYPEVKIIIWDHNRDIIVERADTVLKDKEARDYVWGTGLHWYVNEDFENLTTLHNLYPDKHILFTEGCQEGGVHLGSWLTGERYARNMIGDFNNYCEGYIDWNLTLDETGGPNHVGNLCDAPIISDTKEGKIHYNSSYYYIGHFSKHIQPGALRTFSKCENKDLKTVSFINKNQEEVVIVLNETEKDYDITIKFNDEDTVITSKKRSISTIKK